MPALENNPAPIARGLFIIPSRADFQSISGVWPGPGNRHKAGES